MEHEAENLNWLAQRYVLGEMCTAEAAEFEERLVDDEAAASVADAVRLLSAVKAASHGNCIGSEKRTRGCAAGGGRRWAVCVTGVVAACAALVIVPLASAKRTPRAPLEPAELVGRWNVFRMNALVGGGFSNDSEPPAVEKLPRWLLAAVTIAGETVAREESN